MTILLNVFGFVSEKNTPQNYDKHLKEGKSGTEKWSFARFVFQLPGWLLNSLLELKRVFWMSREDFNFLKSGNVIKTIMGKWFK